MRIVDYIESDHKPPDHYSAELRAKPYKVTEIVLPHDGGRSWLSGQNAQRLYQDLGWRVRVLPQGNVEDGIRAVRMAFPTLYINSACTGLLECLKRYQRVIPPGTSEPSKPLHDAYSHGADALRYAIQAAPQMDSGTADGGGLKLPPLKYSWEFK